MAFEDIEEEEEYTKEQKAYDRFNRKLEKMREKIDRVDPYESYGINQWMNIDQMKQLLKHFKLLKNLENVMIQSQIQNDKQFESIQSIHSLTHYIIRPLQENEGVLGQMEYSDEQREVESR